MTTDPAPSIPWRRAVGALIVLFLLLLGCASEIIRSMLAGGWP
jgi:hypothetical protein